MDARAERASSALQANVLPSAGPNNTLGDCFRSENKINGVFADADWSISFQVVGESRQKSTTDALLRLKLWRSVNADGSGATEVTESTIASTGFTNLRSNTYQTITATWAPGGIVTLTNEYLFLQAALQLVEAGDNNKADVHLAVGPANRVISSEFQSYNTMTTAGLTSGAVTFGSPMMIQKHELTATGNAAGAITLGEPTVSELVDLLGSGIEAGEPAFASPDITQLHFIAAEWIDSGAAVEEEPTIGQIHELEAEGLDTGPTEISNPIPMLTVESVEHLFTNNLSCGAVLFTQPTFSQVHGLEVDPISSGAPVFGEPTMSHIHELVAEAIVTGAAFTSVSIIGQIHIFEAEILIIGSTALAAPKLNRPVGASEDLLEATDKGIYKSIEERVAMQ